MDTNDLTRKGRYMSLLLRHSPEKENLSMDDYGYVKIKDLCTALKINREELDWIVNNNNKKRFTYKGFDLIKATQGHSINIRLELSPVEPPALLYHGTSWDNKDAIMEFGLQKMSRHHVHLTESLETAEQVGLRYAKKRGKLWIITVEAKRMWEDGFDFYKTENNVWLTDIVPSNYFQLEYGKNYND